METTTDEASSTTLETAFTALSNPTRRRILATMSAHNPRTDVEFELADFITPTDDCDRLQTELYHAHLPKLASEDFINWNRETGTVTHGSNFEEIRPVLTVLAEHEEKLPGEWPSSSD